MKALIFGGSGQLGRSMVKVLKGWSITNVDIQPNTDSQENIVFTNQSIEYFKQELNELDKFNCIICVAGGWVGGGIKDEELIQKYEDQYKKHVIPALYCSSLATTHLKNAGLLIFTGAYSVFSGPTPQSIAYALAKTAVHAIAAQASASKELPQDSAVITLLPEIIDTPSNRLAMPKEDFTKWADPDQISGLVRAWSEGLNRPKNGAFVHLRVKNGTIAPDYL